MECFGCFCCLVTQSCPTLCDPMDCSPPGSSVHGILQARILGWVAISFSREFYWPRDWTTSPALEGGFFTTWATREDGKGSIKMQKEMTKTWKMTRNRSLEIPWWSTVKILCFQCNVGLTLIGELRSCMPCSEAKHRINLKIVNFF